MKILKSFPFLESVFDLQSVSPSSTFGKCYNPLMIETLSDTRPEIAALQRKLLRQAGPARKLAMLGQMNQTVITLALSGLRSRHPDDSAEMLHRRLADLILGPELASRVYGPPVAKS
jgi:hypothetical protein